MEYIVCVYQNGNNIHRDIVSYSSVCKNIKLNLRLKTVPSINLKNFQTCNLYHMNEHYF